MELEGNSVLRHLFPKPASQNEKSSAISKLLQLFSNTAPSRLDHHLRNLSRIAPRTSQNLSSGTEGLWIFVRNSGIKEKERERHPSEWRTWNKIPGTSSTLLFEARASRKRALRVKSLSKTLLRVCKKLHDSMKNKRNVPLKWSHFLRGTRLNKALN